MRVVLHEAQRRRVAAGVQALLHVRPLRSGLLAPEVAQHQQRQRPRGLQQFDVFGAAERPLAQQQGGMRKLAGKGGCERRAPAEQLGDGLAPERGGHLCARQRQEGLACILAPVVDARLLRHAQVQRARPLAPPGLGAQVTRLHQRQHHPVIGQRAARAGTHHVGRRAHAAQGAVAVAQGMQFGAQGHIGCRLEIDPGVGHFLPRAHAMGGLERLGNMMLQGACGKHVGGLRHAD